MEIQRIDFLTYDRRADRLRFLIFLFLRIFFDLQLVNDDLKSPCITCSNHQNSAYSNPQLENTNKTNKNTPNTIYPEPQHLNVGQDSAYSNSQLENTDSNSPNIITKKHHEYLRPQLENTDPNSPNTIYFNPQHSNITYSNYQDSAYTFYPNAQHLNIDQSSLHITYSNPPLSAYSEPQLVNVDQNSNNCMYKHYSKEHKLEDEEKTFLLYPESAEGGNSDSRHNFERFNHCLKSVKREQVSLLSDISNKMDINNIKDDDQVLVSSEVHVTADMDPFHAFQNFVFSAYLWTKVDPLPNKRNDLKFSIDSNDCRAGPIISDKWPLLQKLGIGYFLESVKISITPSISDKSFYKLKGNPNPSNLNKDIDMSKTNENNRGIEASISGNYGKRNEQSITSTIKEWELIADGCGVTGLGWRYKFTSNSLFEVFTLYSKFLQIMDDDLKSPYITYSNHQNSAYSNPQFNPNSPNTIYPSPQLLNIDQNYTYIIYSNYQDPAFYRNGIGTIKDEEKAFQWYMKSAEGGDSEGQNNLGTCYEKGIGTTKDENKAFQYMHKHYSKEHKLEDEKKPYRLNSKSVGGENSDGQHNFEGFNHCLKSVDGGTENADKIEDSNNNNNHDNERNETNNHILVSSQANANIADGKEVFQNFIISGYILAKVVANNLEVSIDLNDCRAGKMLSDKWPPLHKLGIGYFLDSVEIWITPIQDESMPNKPLYDLKGAKPWNFNKDMSEDLDENNHGFGSSMSRFNVNYSRRNKQGFMSTTTERAGLSGIGKKFWELIASCRKTGLRWRYQYTANNPFKDLNRRRNFKPGKHSCHWLTSEAMNGFSITITQVLRCKITNGWRKYNPITRSKLKKLCPKMAHTLEISFNSLENFKENFANLKNSENSEKLHGDFLNVTFSKNASPQKISKNYNIGNIEIKRSFTRL